MPYPDLNTLFTHGMGSMAAGYSGQMAQDQQAQDAANLQSTQLQNQQTQVMNPLNAQFRQGQINEQQAQLPGLQGISQSQVAKGSFDTSTLSSDIEAKLSDNMKKIGGYKVAQMGQDGQRAIQAAQIMQNYPVSMHKQILTQFAEQYGGSAQSAMVAPFLQLPDDKVKDALTATATGMVKASANYITKMDEVRENRKGALDQAKVHAGATVEAEKLRATSNERIAAGHDKARIDAAKEHSQAMLNKLGTDGTIAEYARRTASGIITPEETEIYNQLRNDKAIQAAARVPAVAPTVLNQPTPMDAAVDATRRNTGAPAITAPTQLTPDSITKAFGKYEPEKYIYRMGPNGLQRGLK